MIVWIASYPRSGNTFFRTVLWESFGRVRSGDIYPLGEAPSRLTGLSYRVGPESLDRLRGGSDPVFVRTHRLADIDDDSPAVYLVRDGRDAVASYARFSVRSSAPGFEGRSFEDAAEALIWRRDDEIGGWSDNVRSWTRREAPTAIVQFEELIKDPIATIRAAVATVGVALPAPSEQPSSFARLHGENPLIYPRGQVGAWRSELPDRLQRMFWRLHGAEMLLMGYPPERLPVSDRQPA
jgi:sulfotransferase family protein